VKACLINRIDKGLCIVSKEVTALLDLILTREDCLDQGGKFVQAECAFDQTFAGWGVGSWEVEFVRTLYKIDKGMAKVAPLSGTAVVAL